MLMWHWRSADGGLMAHNTGWNSLSFYLWLKKGVSVSGSVLLCSELMSIRTLVSVKEGFVVRGWTTDLLSASTLREFISSAHETTAHAQKWPYGASRLLLPNNHRKSNAAFCCCSQNFDLMHLGGATRCREPNVFWKGSERRGQISEHSKSYWSYMTLSVFTYCILTFPNLTCA